MCRMQPLERSLLPLSEANEREALVIDKLIMRFLRDVTLGGPLLITVANYIVHKVCTCMWRFSYFFFMVVSA